MFDKIFETWSFPRDLFPTICHQGISETQTWVKISSSASSSPLPSPSLERLSAAYYFPPTAERVTWPDFPHLCRLPAAVSTRGGHLPVWRKRENLSICSPFVPTIPSFWSLVFIAILRLSSFFYMIILFVKLKEFQIRAKRDDNFIASYWCCTCLYVIAVYQQTLSDDQ